MEGRWNCVKHYGEYQEYWENIEPFLTGVYYETVWSNLVELEENKEMASEKHLTKISFHLICTVEYKMRINVFGFEYWIP